MITRVLSFYSLVLAWLVAGAWLIVAESVRAESRVVAAGDIVRVELDSGEAGTVVLYLPSDLRAGDDVGGRIEASGYGDGRGLDDWSVVIGDDTARVSDGFGEFYLPADGGEAVVVSALDGDGEVRAALELPLAVLGAVRPGIIPGYAGTGLRWLPGRFDREARARALQSLDPTAKVVSVSPRGVAVLDTLIARGGPVGGATCCDENTDNCGESSCCVDIPSNSCTFCNAGKWKWCKVFADP